MKKKEREKRNNNCEDQKSFMNMVDINSTMSKIILSVSDLCIPTKRYISLEQIKTIILYQQETHCKYKDTKKLKVKGWNKYREQTDGCQREGWGIGQNG